MNIQADTEHLKTPFSLLPFFVIARSHIKKYFRRMTFILAAFTQAERCLSEGRQFLEIVLVFFFFFFFPFIISPSITSTS